MEILPPPPNSVPNTRARGPPPPRPFGDRPPTEIFGSADTRALVPADRIGAYGPDQPAAILPARGAAISSRTRWASSRRSCAGSRRRLRAVSVQARANSDGAAMIEGGSGVGGLDGLPCDAELDRADHVLVDFPAEGAGDDDQVRGPDRFAGAGALGFEHGH